MGGWDEDEDQRRELVRDVRHLLNDGQRVDGILVGGDIAFSATLDQYETARTWLGEMCSVAEVGSSKVWVVPGNHDISRDVIKFSPIAREFRQAVRTCPPHDVDAELKSRLSQDPGARGVMEPL